MLTASGSPHKQAYEGRDGAHRDKEWRGEKEQLVRRQFTVGIGKRANVVNTNTRL